MKIGRPGDANGELGVTAGVSRWLAIHDELLRGVAHIISNRISTIQAAASMLTGGGGIDERIAGMLQGGADELEASLKCLRALPHSSDAALEPMIIEDSLLVAQLLVSSHPKLRDTRFVTVAGNDIEPVLADPAAVSQAIAVMIVGMSNCGRPVQFMTIEMETAGEEVILRIGEITGPDGSEASEYASEVALDCAAINWLLTPSLGHAVAGVAGCEIHLRTLAAGRALEHRDHVA